MRCGLSLCVHADLQLVVFGTMRTMASAWSSLEPTSVGTPARVDGRAGSRRQVPIGSVRRTDPRPVLDWRQLWGVLTNFGHYPSAKLGCPKGDPKK